jgi:concentrative nucleoside transporter, CNT family
VFGLAVFQFGFYLASNARNDIPWNTVIVGLFFQQAIALFVLKSDAGFKIVKKVAGLARELLDEGAHGAQFFFDADTIAKHWFFINTLSAIIFFVAFVQM